MHDITFAREFLEIIITTDSFSYGIEDHISSIRSLCRRYEGKDKDAKLFERLDDTEIKAILRFVEKPHGRHHITEIERMLKLSDSSSVLRRFLEHFYRHEGHKLIHTKTLRKLEG